MNKSFIVVQEEPPLAIDLDTSSPTYGYLFKKDINNNWTPKHRVLISNTPPRPMSERAYIYFKTKLDKLTSLLYNKLSRN